MTDDDMLLELAHSRDSLLFRVEEELRAACERMSSTPYSILLTLLPDHLFGQSIEPN